MATEKDFSAINFIKVDVDVNPNSAQFFSISSVPTFMFFSNDTKIAEVMGADEVKIRKNLIDLAAKK